MNGAKAGKTPGRQHLDREVILSAAIDLAATGSAITFRALGAALGTDPTAVYRHFRDKQELMQALVDRLIIAAQAEVDPEASWRDQLHDGAVHTIDTFAAHPRVGAEVGRHRHRWPRRAGGDQLDPDPAGARRPGQGPSRAPLRGVLQLRPVGGSDPLVAAPARGRRVDVSWVGDLRAVDAARLPALAKVITELAELSDRDVFLTGIEVFLDSVEASARGAADGDVPR